jgi:PKD repeat protein
MKKLCLYLSVLVFSFISGHFFAQESHFKCGLQHQLKEMYAKDPTMEADRNRLIQNAKKYRVEKGEKQIVYTIPVVFHIIHQYGSDNIPDANVYDQMLVLNRDYMLLNSDTSEILPIFDTVKGKAFIQFQLASKDPWGNCTNGIEHIYSHESTQGDDNSKLQGWHRSNYLNIWVVSSMRDGVAGYAYYPSDGLDFYRDGIIILNNYIGRNFPSSEYSSRALTHEVGHYLGLSHVWGDNNDPGQACGDDQLEDTPVTKGFTSCPVNNSDICVPGQPENLQNYMDYSYCSVMFTEDQVDLMRYNLTQEIAERSTLITDSTHTLTGIDALSPPLCTPVADFHASDRFICQGTSVTFEDVSWRAAVEGRTWTFEGGSPSTSTNSIQSVTYDTPGYKKVTLSVQNANGVDELIQENYIHVSPLWGDFTGPYSNNMENGFENWFLVNNPENNAAKFHIVNGFGVDHSRCYKLDNFRNTGVALPYTNEWFYGRRLGGSVDELISPSFDLRNTSGITVSFDYAYATNGTVLTTVGELEADITEKVKVYSSKNCGKTWTLKKTVDKGTLLTAGFAGGADFAPQSNNQWKNCSFTYTATSTDSETRFKIEFTASDVSNNFYVDNFNVTGTLGLFANEVDNLEVIVSPNPLSTQQIFQVSYVAGDYPVEFILRDVQGKTVHTEKVAYTNTKVNHSLEMGQQLSPSCYFLEVKSGAFSVVKKLIVL